MKKPAYALITTLIVVLAIPAMSQTLVVGTCKQANHHYTTIQSAVQAAPEDATVLVCPGTYAEQVVITTPLTLKGISVPPLNNPTIVGPSGGVTTGPVQPATGAGDLASIIAVDTGGTPGPVNIQGILVDAITACQFNGQSVVGILYLSTSGAIRDSAIRNMSPQCGTSGVWVENDDRRPMTLTAKDNIFRGIYSYGILAYSGPSSSGLSFLLQDNTFSQVGTAAIIDTNGDGVRVTGNYIGAFANAMVVNDASTVDHNVITTGGQAYALEVNGSGSNITANTITVSSGSTGIRIDSDNADGATSVTWNRITGNGQGGKGIISGPNVSIRSNTLGILGEGIVLGCNGNQVSSNTIFDTAVGIDGVPAGASLSNDFFNVPTPQVACP
jgi:hypothetical protein